MFKKGQAITVRFPTELTELLQIEAEKMKAHNRSEVIIEVVRRGLNVKSELTASKEMFFEIREMIQRLAEYGGPATNNQEGESLNDSVSDEEKFRIAKQALQSLLPS